MYAYPLFWGVMCGVQVVRCNEPDVSRDRLMLELCVLQACVFYVIHYFRKTI